MSFLRLLVFTSAIFIAGSGFAQQALFPLNSLRHQGKDNCWAYAASHMLEARLQKRDGISAALDLEKTQYYWTVYDRLLNVFDRKALSEDLLERGGFSANLFSLLSHHGFEIYNFDQNPRDLGFTYDLFDKSGYPQQLGFSLKRKNSNNNLIDTKKVKSLEKELLTSTKTRSEVEIQIKSVLDKAFSLPEAFSDLTAWGSSQIQTPQVFNAFTAGEPSALGAGDLVLVHVLTTADDPNDENLWQVYDDDRFWMVTLGEESKFFEVIRTSMDRGWPTTFETDDHAMTLLGYQKVGKKYYYALADSYGIDPAFTWYTEKEISDMGSDITVYYPIVKDLLPKIEPSSKQGLFVSAVVPSKWLPRKR